MAIEDSPNPGGYLVLTSLSVDNLRSLQSLSAVPLETNLTVLAGQNGGGKTSFIDALSILLKASSPREEAQSSLDEELIVEGSFTSLDANEPIFIRARCSQGRVNLELLQKVHPIFGKPPADMTIQELRQAFSSSGIDSPRGTSKAPFVDMATKWIEAQPPDDLQQAWTSLPKEVRDRLPQLTVFQSKDADNQPDQVKRLVQQDSIRLLETEPLATRLMGISKDIQEGVEPLLNAIKNKILEYCPAITDVMITPQFDFTRISPHLKIDLTKKSGESVDLGEVGSGISQRVGLAIYAANHERLMQSPDDSVSSLLAYDEPDTHLDYHAQRDLFSIIREQSELAHVQVIVATHSINLIDKVSMQTLRHFRLEDQRTVVELPADYSYEQESEFVEDLAAGLGLRNSVLLSERCFLVVEGETEERALPILFRKVTGETLASAGISPIGTGGSGSVRGFVETLIQKLNRTVVVLADQDARESQKRLSSDWLEEMGLKEGEDGFFVGTKEFEDAFSDATWLRVANEAFPLDNGSAWSENEFAVARTYERGMGDALAILFSRRLQRRVRKPEIGEALASTVTIQEVPDAVQAAMMAAWNRSKAT